MRYITQALNRRPVRQLIILLVFDALVFGSSNVKIVPSFMLAVGFVLLMATAYYLFYGLAAAMRIYGIKFKHRRELAMYMTALVAILVSLQTIGELSPRDVVVLMPLMAIGYLYKSYGEASKRSP